MPPTDDALHMHTQRTAHPLDYYFVATGHFAATPMILMDMLLHFYDYVFSSDFRICAFFASSFIIIAWMNIEYIYMR